MKYLVYWYGSPNIESAFSFLSNKDITNYDVSKKPRHLIVSERAQAEIQEDLKRKPENRKGGRCMPDFQEGWERLPDEEILEEYGMTMFPDEESEDELPVQSKNRKSKPFVLDDSEDEVPVPRKKQKRNPRVLDDDSDDDAPISNIRTKSPNFLEELKADVDKIRSRYAALHGLDYRGGDSTKPTVA